MPVDLYVGGAEHATSPAVFALLHHVLTRGPGVDPGCSAPVQPGMIHARRSSARGKSTREMSRTRRRWFLAGSDGRCRPGAKMAK